MPFLLPPLPPIVSSMHRYECGFTTDVIFLWSNRAAPAQNKQTNKKTVWPPHKLFPNNWGGEKERQAVVGIFPIISFFSSLPPAKAKWKLLPRDASALNALNYNQMLSLSLLKIRKLIIGHIFKACDASTLFLFHFRNKTSDNLSSNITNTPPR